MKGKLVVDELKPEVIRPSSKAEPPQDTSRAWSSGGQTPFAGYANNLVQVQQVTVSTHCKYMPELQK